MGTQKKTSNKLKSVFLNLVIYISLLVGTLIIFGQSLGSYFFQDDWFTFTISRADNINEFINFFIPRTDIIYYRPIGMQVYFFLMEKLFGVTPLAFRLSAVLVNSINGFILYLLLNKLKFKKLISFFGSLIFVGSVTVYIPFFWSATFPFILGPLFFLLGFLSYIAESLKNHKIIAFIFFILGMLTLENTIILSGIMFLWVLFYKRKILIIEFIPYAVIAVLYITLRTIIFPTPLDQTYEITISLFSTLRTYSLWLFNWPEEIARQMVGPFTINPIFLKDFGSYVKIWLLSSGLTLLLTVVLPISVIVKVGIFTDLKRHILFSLSWVFISIFPLILFSNHTFPYYLPVTLFGFIIFISALISEFFAKIKINKLGQIFYLLLIIILWYLGSITTIVFNSKVYWAPKRAKAAYHAITKLYPQIDKPKKYIIYIQDKDLYLPLNNKDALHIVFGDHVNTVYELQELDSLTNKDDYQVISL